MDEEYQLTDKALELASMMAQTSGIQNMMSNPIMSSVMRKNPARGVQQEQTKTHAYSVTLSKRFIGNAHLPSLRI